MDHDRVEIFNGRLITPGGIIEGGHLLVEQNRILALGGGKDLGTDAIKIDARGNFISPGFIDIHVHGGGGYDFMDGNETAFLQIANTHARYGTTSMLPTTLSGSRENLLDTLNAYESASKKNESGSQFLGMHLEGPYFAMNQRGAQDPKYIRNPNRTEYEDILNHFPFISRWSVAPELPGALDMGRELHSRGILTSIAHTDAIYEEVLGAMASGYSLVTHLYSAMSGVTRRKAMRFAGVIESAFLIDELDVEIIADGVHLPAPLLKLVFKIKGPDRTALITDAMRAASMPAGESVLGHYQTGLKVIIEDEVAKLPDRSSFAGSVATADRLVRTMMNVAGISLPDAIKMITSTPARILGLTSTKGSLAPGKHADIVIFDDEINIQLTMIGGRIVYRREARDL
jgi:N-acetylglucosamine-6-phosphate deacetylase